MSFPKHYYNKLSKQDTKTQLKELKKSKKDYKKGIYHIRPKMDSFKGKKSKHIVEFEKKYCVVITDLKNVSKVTKVPINILKKVINKGMGAYYSSGSRPNQTPHSWGYARLASTLLKHNAYKIDKHLFIKNNKLINIEKPKKNIKCNNLKMKGGAIKNKKNKSIINCNKIKDQKTKHKKCIRANDKKIFKLPRRFSKKQCQNSKGFTMRSSCAIYK